MYERGYSLLGEVAIEGVMGGTKSNVKVTEQDLIADETTAVERSSAAATHVGMLIGAPPTGKACHLNEIHIYRFNAAGKVVEHWVEWSTFELLTQLGMTKMWSHVGTAGCARTASGEPGCYNSSGFIKSLVRPGERGSHKLIALEGRM